MLGPFVVAEIQARSQLLLKRNPELLEARRERTAVALSGLDPVWISSRIAISKCCGSGVENSIFINSLDSEYYRQSGAAKFPAVVHDAGRFA